MRNTSRTESALLREFDAIIEEHRRYCAKLETLVREILADAGINVHSVTARHKDREKFAEKVVRHEGKYLRVSDVTDLTGIRIITYFADDVDRTAEIIEREFIVDEENSIDRRHVLDPDRFGYLSLHYVVTLPKTRKSLPEYKRFGELKAEIQVRSILQHAWAEIEHDLGYKTAVGVPRETRRQFSRLAGLLEVADAEFTAIRKALMAYERELPARIADPSEDVLLDKASLLAFVRGNDVSRRIAASIAGQAGASVGLVSDEFIEAKLAPLQLLGIDTIAQLEHELVDKQAMILAFSQAWIGGATGATIMETSPLLYLNYVLAGQTGEVNFIRRFLTTAGLGSEYDREAFAKRILDTYSGLPEPGR